MSGTTPLKTNIENLLAIFKKYAKEDGDSKTLSKAEAKKLLKNEMPEILENPNDSAQLKSMVEDLDMDGDGKIDFMEFMALVMSLGFITYFMDEAGQ